MEVTQKDIEKLNCRLDKIDENIANLKTIDIVIKNGHDKHIKYRRSEFFQMLYDRKNVWKDRARLTAKDSILFIGLGLLILKDVLGIL